MKWMVFILLFLSIGCASTMAKKNPMEMGANTGIVLKRKPSSNNVLEGSSSYYLSYKGGEGGLSSDYISYKSGEVMCFLSYTFEPVFAIRTTKSGGDSPPIDGNATHIIQKECNKNKDIWMHPVSSEGKDYDVRICCTKK